MKTFKKIKIATSAVAILSSTVPIASSAKQEKTLELLEKTDSIHKNTPFIQKEELPTASHHFLSKYGLDLDKAKKLLEEEREPSQNTKRLKKLEKQKEDKVKKPLGLQFVQKTKTKKAWTFTITWKDVDIDQDFSL